ncbi:hypothetical protein SNEBB_000315 [Seison nebaliae]|nr:hypothetical protein SNEBB_000315 [Seison nebaliae]
MNSSSTKTNKLSSSSACRRIIFPTNTTTTNNNNTNKIIIDKPNVNELLNNILNEHLRLMKEKWNFDFDQFTPLNGRYEWVDISPHNNNYDSKMKMRKKKQLKKIRKPFFLRN